MAYCFQLVTRDGELVEKIESGENADDALEGIFEKCLLDEPGIFFEMDEELMGSVPEGLQLHIIKSYGVYVKGVEEVLV